MRKNYKKQTNKIQNRKSDQEKKKINYMSNGKVLIIHLIAGVITKT